MNKASPFPNGSLPPLAEQDIDRLLQVCYHGPLESSPWLGFLKQLKSLMQARYVTFLLRPPRVGDKGVVLNAFVMSDTAYNEYKEYYFSQDPFINLPLDKAVTVEEVLDIDQFRQSEYYLKYLQPVDVEYILGIDFEDENGYCARLRISRGKASSNFADIEKHVLEFVLPHLKQSIALYTRIAHAESQAQAYQDAFNQMEMGCILLDRKLSVMSRNKAAENFLQQKQGVVLKDNQLVVGNREENRQFRQLLEAMLEKQSRLGFADVVAFRVETAQSLAGLGLLCRALPPASTPDAGPALVLFISDPEKPRLSKVTILEQLFGLTLSEAKLALLLANGFSLDEAAEELGITRNTAKSHLSATFAKTGVTRQPSLVQLILRSVASIS